MSATKLLPCPFCGSEASVGGNDGRFYVTCNSIDCYCAFGEAYNGYCMPDHAFFEEEAAIEAWNKRVPAVLSEELKQLADDANSAADRMIEAADRFLNHPQD